MVDYSLYAFNFSDLLGRLGGVDLILTDPPYSISRDTGFSHIGKMGVDRFAVSMDFGKLDRCGVDLSVLANGMYRSLRRGGTAIVFYDIWKISYLRDCMVSAGFRMVRLIIWEKANPVPLNMRCTYLSNSREVAVVGVKGGSPTFNGEYDRGVYRYPIPHIKGGRLHPNQKPLGLFSELISKHSCECDLVVDPFLGSGTTGVASVLAGRKFIGGDIDEKYVGVSKRRMESECE